jgi:hypothetical protein
MKLPIFVEKPELDCVITFGVSGWSSYFFASLPLDHTCEQLIKTCQRRIPEAIRKSHPANENLKWIKIYRISAKLDIKQVNDAS